jgi:putative MATE family efflux protein
VLTSVSAADLRRTTWTLAWPVIFAFSIESLVGLLDTLMVGRLGSTAVAAVGVGIQILSAVDSAMFAAATGALAIVARHIGAGEVRAAEEVLQQAILAAIAIAVLSVAPVLVWTPELIRALRVDPAVVEMATPFVRIVMLGVPATAVLFVIVTSLRGAGDTRTPLVIGGVVGAVNVGLAWVLIFGKLGLPALGVTGAAIASVLGFASGAALGLWLLHRGGLLIRLERARWRLRLGVVRRVLRIGYPAALEHLLMQVGFIFYVVFAAHHGTAAIAAYFIGVRILALSFLPGIGFAAAAGALVGQNLGAERPDEAARSGRAATELSVGLMTAAGIVIFVAARPIARLFVDDPEVVAEAVAFIRVLAALQPLMAIDFTLGGALRGAGDTRFPLAAVFIGFYVCRLGTAWLVTFGLGLGVLWLWLAIVGDYLARAVLKSWRFRSGAWQRINV